MLLIGTLFLLSAALIRANDLLLWILPKNWLITHLQLLLIICLTASVCFLPKEAIRIFSLLSILCLYPLILPGIGLIIYSGFKRSVYICSQESILLAAV